MASSLQRAAVVALLIHAAMATSCAHNEPVVIHPTFDGLRAGADNRETYDLNAVGLLETSTVIVNAIGQPQSPADWSPIIGKYRNPMPRPDFIRMLGRDDILRTYDRRKIVGVVVFVVAAGLFATSIYEYKQHKSDAVVFGFGGGACLTTGLGVALVSSQGLLTTPQAEDAAAQYNAALRAHLGLPPLPSKPAGATDGGDPVRSRLLSGLRLGVGPDGSLSGNLTMRF